MLIKSDWHIHSEYSYDATNSLETIAENAKEQGLRFVGITDHLNFNDEKFIGDIKASSAGVKATQKKYPCLVLGVELTPIALHEFEHIAKTGSREGYVYPTQCTPCEMELGMSKAELMGLGVKYAVGAAHWRLDDYSNGANSDLDGNIREWHRQQMWLACDERVTILGHPWFHGKGIWYEDFSVIPRSMNTELAAALKENGKYVECNAHFFRTELATEKFKRQYCEFLRELFEQGIPVTYGSDAHKSYADERESAEKYLTGAGFREGDISEIAPKDFWL